MNARMSFRQLQLVVLCLGMVGTRQACCIWSILPIQAYWVRFAFWLLIQVERILKELVNQEEAALCTTASKTQKDTPLVIIVYTDSRHGVPGTNRTDLLATVWELYYA